MKTNFSKLVMVATCFTIISSSCKKEGPMGPAGPAGTNGAANVEVYSATMPTELLLPVLYTPSGFTGSTWDEDRVVYSILIPNLQIGDKLILMAEAQVDLDPSYPIAVGYASVLKLTESATDTYSSPTSITLVDAISGYLDPDADWANPDLAGSYECTEVLGDRYVNFIMKANSSNDAYSDNNHFANVLGDYGQLDVVVIRAAQ